MSRLPVFLSTSDAKAYVDRFYPTHGMTAKEAMDRARLDRKDYDGVKLLMDSHQKLLRILTGMMFLYPFERQKNTKAATSGKEVAYGHGARYREMCGEKLDYTDDIKNTVTTLLQTWVTKIRKECPTESPYAVPIDKVWMCRECPEYLTFGRCHEMLMNWFQCDSIQETGKNFRQFLVPTRPAFLYDGDRDGPLYDKTIRARGYEVILSGHNEGGLFAYDDPSPRLSPAPGEQHIEGHQSSIEMAESLVGASEDNKGTLSPLPPQTFKPILVDASSIWSTTHDVKEHSEMVDVVVPPLVCLPFDAVLADCFLRIQALLQLDKTDQPTSVFEEMVKMQTSVFLAKNAMETFTSHPHMVYNSVTIASALQMYATPLQEWAVVELVERQLRQKAEL